ncbi:Gfo/Idh/MocA family oxidoreductase [Glutamicibacter sp. PS]|uniref:Gfo/Idh/MocA family protein n=1 Tax=Glutamicibacter sp. PS TaxID=3075634 RepID=UPI00284A76EC|nr:Gfo/Idh/MocA family oxidoreductase [Glutamicibacter sp. PS]MDR4534617.1 Gfo/Idh/MocA family oxidoreductase [Glutamicibacter sp. PS]
MTQSLGIAVIGAGMAGLAHIAGYRTAPTLYNSELPALRYVAVADVNTELATTVAKRYGYAKALGTWHEVAADPDIDVVSVVIANRFHREAVEGLLAAGKHVLCEKPLADTLEEAEAMAAAARDAASLARVGFTFRRTPGIAAIRDLIKDGTLGKVLHFSGRYWTDYGHNWQAPMSWRYKGGPGSGALADVGSHLSYIAEFLAGEIRSVSGGQLSTSITERYLPVGAVTGHDLVELSNIAEPVENDDYAAFNVQFADAVGSLEVSRVAAGHPNGLSFEVFCEKGAARFNQQRPSQIEIMLADGPSATNGYRTVDLGPEHAYIGGGLPMDAPGVGVGQNDAFAYQARAFLDEVAGASTALPANATFDEGVHNMRILQAVVESAANHGKKVTL